MKNITRKEEIIMLAILNLKKEAYLISIVDHLSKITGTKMSLTSVHLPLNRLEKNGMISGELGEATAVRGGRRKKIYKITQAGYAMLNEHKRISDLLWKDYAEFLAPRE